VWGYVRGNLKNRLWCAYRILRNDHCGPQTANYDWGSGFDSRSSFRQLAEQKHANLPILSSRQFLNDTFCRHDYRKTGLELCRRSLLCFFSIFFLSLINLK